MARAHVDRRLPSCATRSRGGPRLHEPLPARVPGRCPDRLADASRQRSRGGDRAGRLRATSPRMGKGLALRAPRRLGTSDRDPTRHAGHPAGSPLGARRSRAPPARAGRRIRPGRGRRQSASSRAHNARRSCCSTTRTVPWPRSPRSSGAPRRPPASTSTVAASGWPRSWGRPTMSFDDRLRRELHRTADTIEPDVGEALSRRGGPHATTRDDRPRVGAGCGRRRAHRRGRPAVRQLGARQRGRRVPVAAGRIAGSVRLWPDLRHVRRHAPGPGWAPRPR